MLIDSVVWEFRQDPENGLYLSIPWWSGPQLGRLKGQGTPQWGLKPSTHLLMCLVSVLQRLKTKIASQNTYTWPLHPNWLPHSMAAQGKQEQQSHMAAGPQTQVLQITRWKLHCLLHSTLRNHITFSIPSWLKQPQPVQMQRSRYRDSIEKLSKILRAEF